MPKERIKLGESYASMVRTLCEYYGISVEDLIIKLISDEWDRKYKDLNEKGLA